MKFYNPQFSPSQRVRFLKKAAEVLKRGDFINGTEVVSLEATLSRYFRRPFVSCNSGSDALVLALRALGIGRGDEVITTGFTYFATIGAIYQVGAIPILVDIDRATYNIDPLLIEQKITKKTKAILPVHLFGLSCDMGNIMKIAALHKLYVIEDAAQSFGASYHGKLTGTFGDAGCFSFFPTKNLGGFGDGGGIAVKNKQMQSYIQALKAQGQTHRYVHTFMGYNSRLDTLQAALLLERFKLFESERVRRKVSARKWIRELAPDPAVLNVPSQKEHTYNQFSALVKDRKSFIKKLGEKEIPSIVYYPTPVYRQKAFIREYGKIQPLRNCEFVSRHIVSLPILSR